MSSERRFSLLIPGLLGPSQTSHGAVPMAMAGVPAALETLLARAQRLDLQDAITLPDKTSVEACLFRLFDLPSTADTDLPVAAVTRVADGGALDDAWWIRADPVCLLPQGVGLLLQPGADLGLSLAQSRDLVNEILQVFAADGWHLEAPVAHRWYLRPATPPVMQTTPLAQVAGRDINPFLPKGKDAKPWHVAMNEIQILLHTAGVNIERESSGQAPINSVWFWGGGVRPILPPVRWTQLWSDEVLSRGLATLAGLTHQALPKGAVEVLAQAQPGAHLLVMEPDTILARAGETDRWREFFMRLEQQWIAPLAAAVKSGSVHSVTLYSEAGHGFLLNRKTLGRWWRRRHSLSHYQ